MRIEKIVGKENLQLQTHIWDILAQAEWHRLKLGVDDCHDVLLVILLLLACVVGRGVMLLLQAVNVIAAVLDVSLTKNQTYKDIEIWAYKDTKIHRYKFTIKKLERYLFRKKMIQGIEIQHNMKYKDIRIKSRQLDCFDLLPPFPRLCVVELVVSS